MTMIYAPCPFPTCVSFPSPTLLMPAQDQPSSYKTKACRHLPALAAAPTARAAALCMAMCARHSSSQRSPRRRAR